MHTDGIRGVLYFYRKRHDVSYIGVRVERIPVLTVIGLMIMRRGSRDAETVSRYRCIGGTCDYITLSVACGRGAVTWTTTFDFRDRWLAVGVPVFLYLEEVLGSADQRDDS